MTLTVRLLSNDHVEEITGVTSLQVPGAAGDVTLLPKHATMVIGLTKGTVTVKPMGKTLDIEKGFLKVENNLCTLTLFPKEAQGGKELSLPSVDETFDRCVKETVS